MSLITRAIIATSVILFVIFIVIPKIFALFNESIDPFKIASVFMLTALLWYIVLGRPGLAILGVLMLI